MDKQIDELKTDIDILGEQLRELRAFAQTLVDESTEAPLALRLAITTIYVLVKTAAAWVEIALKEGE